LAWAVAGVALLAYTNAIPNGFAFDDAEQILNNVWLTDVRYIGTIFTSHLWGFQPGAFSNFYRPLIHVVFLTLFQLFGPTPWLYHLVNVLLHAANSALVFFVVYRLLTDRSERRDTSGVDARTAQVAALAAGVLFAVHTIHTEAVAWIAGLPEVAYTSLLLLTFWWHLDTPRRSSWKPAISGGAFFSALLFKESAVVLLPLLTAHDLLWIRPSSRRQQAKKYVSYLIVLLFYLVLRTTVMGGTGSMRPFMPYGTLPVPAYVANVLWFFWLYVAKLVIPVDLNVLHVFPVLESLLDARALIGAAAVAGCVMAVVATWRRAPRICFALLLTLLPMLPVVLVPAYSNSPFGERYLYLPSVGLSLLAAIAVASLGLERRWRAAATGVAFALLAGAMLAGTILRNRVWRNDLTLFSDVVAKSPDSEIGNGNLGRALMAAGRYDEAVGRFRKALEVNPASVKARYHVGSALLKAGRPEEAIVEFEALLKVGFATDAAGQLAEAYGAVERLDAAISTREKIVAALPDSPVEHNLLGIDLARASRYEDAMRQFDIAVRLDPNEPAYRRNLDRARDRIRR
jgi:tetratricopeptide (TPR) repeat protein